MLERVFVYGSLQHPVVLQRLLRRQVPSQAARLPGYIICGVAGADYPAITRASGYQAAAEQVEGRLLLGVTRAELQRLDAYEGGLYARRLVRVITHSNEHDWLAAVRVERRAWVYVVRDFARAQLRPGAWRSSVMWQALDHPFKVQRYVQRQLL